MDLVPIIIAAISGGAFFSFIQFLISRKDKKTDDLTNLDKRIVVLEKTFSIDKAKYEDDMHEIKKAIARTNLFLLIHNSKIESSVLEAAREYFVVFGGNSYAKDVFDKWLLENNLNKPEWYINERYN